MLNRKSIMALGALAAFASISPLNYEPLDQYSIAPRRFMKPSKPKPADPKKKAQRKAQGKARARSRK